MIETPLRGREVKARVLAALKLEDSGQALAMLAELPVRQVVNPLFSFFCSTGSHREMACRNRDRGCHGDAR